MADWYVSSAAWAALPQWAASTAYTVGQIIRPLAAPAFGHEYAFRCTTAGTSGTTEPTWPVANNATVTGGATFTNVSGQSTYAWSAPAGTLFSISNGISTANRPVAGDRVLVSSDHSETNAGAPATYGFSSSGFGLIQIISVNRAGSVPPVAADALSGASVTVTAGLLIIDCLTNVYYQGVTFIQAWGNITFGANTNAKAQIYLKNCLLSFTTTSAIQKITSNSVVLRVTLDNTPVQFGNAGQSFGFPAATPSLDLIWLNTSNAIAGATVPTALFANSAGANLCNVTLRGVDLSALTTTLYNSGSWAAFKMLLDGCRIASGLTRYPASGTNLLEGDEVELVNCYDGANSISERYTAAGALTTDRATYLTGGAQDDFGNFAHKLASNANAGPLVFTLDSFWLDVENTAVGASHTATVEIVSSASLNNADVILRLEYLGTSGRPTASFVDSFTVLGTVSALPTSSATWNSPPGTPVYQHVQVSFTPQQAGRLRGIVRLGKPSTTVWMNPQIAVT